MKNYLLVLLAVLVSGCIKAEYKAVLEFAEGVEELVLINTDGEEITLTEVDSKTKVQVAYSDKKEEGLVTLKNSFGKFAFPIVDGPMQTIEDGHISLLLLSEDTGQAYDLLVNYLVREVEREIYSDWIQCRYPCSEKPGALCYGRQWVRVTEITDEVLGTADLVSPENDSTLAGLQFGPKLYRTRHYRDLGPCR